MLAVVEHHPRQRVIAATPAAQARGVTIGGSVAGALAVAPELNLRTRDIALEAATLTELASWAGQFTPGVSLAPPDAVLLETSSSLRLFGGATILAQRIRQKLPCLGLNAHLAAAPTPLAACWLARTQPGKLVHATPDWWQCLDNLSVELLTEDGAVSNATLELLQGIGAHRIGDAARLPRDGLARRQAGAVNDALARARGDRPDPRPWFVPAARFESRLALPASIANTETLLFAARRLFASLSTWLATRHAVPDGGGCD
jgi:protein ImuB